MSRVPKQYARVESRTVVWCSLKAYDLNVAKVKHKEVWEQFMTAWEALKQGEEGVTEERFLAAKELAKAKGIKFFEPKNIARYILIFDGWKKQISWVFAQKWSVEEVLKTPSLAIVLIRSAWNRVF